MRRESILQGALFLVGANLINRILAFINQVAFMRLIGPEGYGLFSQVFPFYILVLVLATAGLPPAMAKLVAEQAARGNWPGVARLYRFTFLFLVISGSIFTVGMWLALPWFFSRVVSDDRSYLAFVIMVPGVILVALSSALRGLFMGINKMGSIALAQIIEQVVRVVTGLVIALALAPRGIHMAVAGYTAGMMIGELTGFLFMVWQRYRLELLNTEQKTAVIPAPIAGPLFKLALPITAGRVLGSLSLSLEAFLVPWRLRVAGLGISEATVVYGAFTGMALTLVFLPTVLTTSLSTAMLPAVAEASALQHEEIIRSRIGAALRLTFMISLPAAVTLLLFPGELQQVVFNYGQGAAVLGAMAAGVPFLYLAQTTSGIIQGFGEVKAALINGVMAILAKTFCLYWLTGLPQLGIIGTAFALNVGFAVNAVLNLRTVVSRAGLPVINLRRDLLVPLLAVTAMTCTMVIIWYGTQTSVASLKIQLLMALGGGYLLYLLILLIGGAVSKSEIRRLPFIGRFLAF